MVRNWWLAILIILVAIGLRFYKLGALPNGLYWDEIAMLADAKAVAETGRDMHNQPWYQVMYLSYGDYKLPVYIWFASVAVMLFGVSDWALRLPSALAGVATVLMAGALGYEMMAAYKDTQKARYLALLSMVVVAVSPWSVLFSRTGFEGHIGQLWLSLSVYFAFVSLRKPWAWWLVPIVGALATYTYFSVRFVWPGVLVALLLVFWSRSLSRPWLKRQNIKVSGVRLARGLGALLLFGLCLVPMMRSPLYQASTNFRLGTTSVLNMRDYALESNVYREMAGNTVIDRIYFHRYFLMGRELALNYADHLNLNFLFLSGDSNLRHGTGQVGLFTLIGLPLFFLGWSWWWRRDPRLVALFLVWWLAAVLPASVPDNTPHALRTLNALMPLSLVVAGGGVAVVESVARWGKQVAVVVVVALIALSSWPWWYHYTHFYAQESEPDWQGNYHHVSDAIFELRTADQPVSILSFDYRFYLWLLSYGPYSAAEYQQWPKKNALLTSFDGIDLDARSMVQTEQIVAGKKSKIEEFLTEQKLKILDQREIKGYTPETTYLVVKVTPGTVQ